jgi:TolB-like protein
MASDPHPPAPGGPLTLFLSYSRPDRAVAQRLADALHKAGHVVWWDALIEGGAKFASSIRAALDSAEVVIVLWSESAIDSDWVRDEAAQGRDRHRLVPLSIDGSQPPLGFRQYQVIDFARWNGHAGAPEFAAMLRAIALAAGHEAGPATPLPIARPGPRSSRRQLLGGVGAGTLVAGTGAVVAWRNFAAPAPAAARGIAVLPFKNLSGDPEQDYFAAGLTEEVRAALAANDAFQVVAATSSNVAHEGADSATKMARNLGVAYLLDGSVQLSRDIVRIAASLTDGKTGFTRWSQSIDRKLNDIFAVQNAIARTVSAALQVRMATDRPAPGGTRNLGAYENFLRGRALYNQAKDEATDRAALAHFDLAIAADDHFAMAYAARSRSLASIAAEYAKAEELKPLYASSPRPISRSATSCSPASSTSRAHGPSTIAHMRWAAATPTSSSCSRFIARARAAPPKPAQRSAGPLPSTHSTRARTAPLGRSTMPRAATRRHSLPSPAPCNSTPTLQMHGRTKAIA